MAQRNIYSETGCNRIAVSSVFYTPLHYPITFLSTLISFSLLGPHVISKPFRIKTSSPSVWSVLLWPWKFTLRRLERYFGDHALRGESVFSMLCPSSFYVYFLGRIILVYTYSPLVIVGILSLALTLRLIAMFSFFCIALFVTLLLGLSPCNPLSCLCQTLPRWMTALIQIQVSTKCATGPLLLYYSHLLIECPLVSILTYHSLY